MIAPAAPPALSTGRALVHGLSTAFGQRASLGVIAAFAALGGVELALGLSVLAFLTRGATALEAAVGGLVALWLLASLLRFFLAALVLRRADPVPGPASLGSAFGRGALALLGTVGVELLGTAWRWVALTASGWAYVAALAKGRLGGASSFGLALCLCLCLALSFALRLWVETAFAASVVHDEPFALALRRAAVAIAARPFVYVAILLLTGLAAFVSEAGVGGIAQLFAAAGGGRSQLSLSLAARAVSAVLCAWPLALAWLARLGAFAALERAGLGRLPLPTAMPPRAIPVAQILRPEPTPTPEPLG